MAKSILIREAVIGDADWLIEGNIAMAVETEGKALDGAVVAEGVRAALADPEKARYFIAEIDGTYAGQAMVTREWSDWRNGTFWWIQSVYVALHSRRLGVYRRIHDHVRETARAAGDVCGLRLYVETANEIAQTTYRAVGMVDAGYRLYEEDWSRGS